MSILEQFNFNSSSLRVAGTSKEPLFCLVDICGILEIRNPSDLITRLDGSNLAKTEVAFERSTTSLWFVNEPGLYEIIFRSNKPEAVANRSPSTC